MIFQLRFVLRSYSQTTHETNQQFMKRRGFKTAKTQVMQRLKQFLKRQHKGDKAALLQYYLPRAEGLADSLPHLIASQRSNEAEQQQQQACTECGALFVGTGALRRHSQKHHPGVRLFPKGPRFDPKKHSKAGTPECIACGRSFRSYFLLRQHVEASTCPRVRVFLQSAEEAEQQTTELDQVHETVKQESLRDPASAASNPDLHIWLMESCALCGQALAGNKAVKQHLNRQHPEVMRSVQHLITPRLQLHKVMMKKGSSCRYTAKPRSTPQAGTLSNVSLSCKLMYFRKLNVKALIWHQEPTKPSQSLRRSQPKGSDLHK